MNEAQDTEITFEGGPRHGETDTVDRDASVIGSGDEGGVYQRTNDARDGLAIYQWHPLTTQESAALVNADLRQNQGRER